MAALAQDIEEIVVEADALAPRTEAVEQTLTGEEAARVPGVQGDAVKAVEVLAGVARPPAGAEGFAIWGASPADTRLYVDDIPVPRLFHRGGLRSVLPSSLVETVTVVPGGAGARYGRGLGGVVHVRTADPGDGWGGAVAVDPVDAALSVRGPGARVGGRYGLLPHTLGAVVPSRTLIPVPASWDAHAQARTTLPGGDELSVVLLAVDDRVERGVPALRPDDRFSEVSRSGYGRLGLGVRRYEGDVVTVSSGWIGVDGASTRWDFGDVGVRDEVRMLAGGVLLSQERRLTEAVDVTLGLDAQVGRTRSARDGALTLPAREGDIVAFGQAPGNRVNRDTWTVRSAALGSFVSARLRPVRALTIAPGLRFEPTVLDGDRVLPVRPTEPPVGYSELAVFTDPRLRVTVEPAPAVEVYAAGGRHHQPPAATDLSPVFGSPVLAPARAWQGLGGVRVQPVGALTAEVTGFASFLDDLPVRPFTPTPPVAGLLVSRGQGRTVGAQATVQATVSAFGLWLAYTWMKAERRASPLDPWRPFDQDQTHGVQAAAGWTRRRWELGARFGLASGFPRTPVVGAVFDARGGVYDPVFGNHNAERLPLFASLALRAAWKRETDWGRYRAWVDVQNATNRANAEEFVYRADFARRDEVRGLPVLPVIGVEVAR